MRAGNPSEEDLWVIDEWRAAHRPVLNTFQALLRNRTRGKGITVAQRHKRRKTIFDKLDRQKKMALARMDDVAGCRLIFRNVSALNSFREELHRARFGHKLRNDVDKYDYIKSPKDTGYRGIHDVYEYDVRSEQGKPLTGLYVEIQYRTLVQHAWATTVELIGFVTQSQPKFQRGDKRYELAMSYASEMLARAFESAKGPHPDLPDREVVRRFSALDRELGLIRMLRGLSAVKKAVNEKRNAILVFRPDGELEVRSYRDAPDALAALFELEKEHPDYDPVLVRADTSEGIRVAFRNYFSDASDFLRMINLAKIKLGAVRVVRATRVRKKK